MKIDNAIDGLIELILEGYPVPERAHIAPNMEVTRRLDTGKDSSWAHVRILAKVVTVCNAGRP
jgi:hypothetical protein